MKALKSRAIHLTLNKEKDGGIQNVTQSSIRKVIYIKQFKEKMKIETTA